MEPSNERLLELHTFAGADVTQLRIGILGSGAMAQTHLNAWRVLGAPWIGIQDRNLEATATLSARFGARVYDTSEALLHDCDVLDVCLPTFLHREAVEMAARAGKHAICEKPLALTLEDGSAMIEACEAAGVRLYVAQVLRFFPQYRQAAQLARVGKLGALKVMHFKRVGSPPYGGAAWFADDSLSGGVVVDMMLHDLDYALMLAGEVSRVYARITRTPTQQYVQAVLTHASGTLSHFECGWAYAPGLFRTAFDLSGDTGLLEWSSDAPGPLTRIPPVESVQGGVLLPVVSPASDPYTAQLEHAAHCFETGTPFEVTPQDALGALKVALAVRESAQSGRAVSWSLEGAL